MLKLASGQVDQYGGLLAGNGGLRQGKACPLVGPALADHTDHAVIALHGKITRSHVKVRN